MPKHHTLHQRNGRTKGISFDIYYALKFYSVVEFVEYTLQYRPTLPPALKSLSFSVNPGEKIGVVGRTGAGKCFFAVGVCLMKIRSSLMVALFRLSEASAGRIQIDGVDIARVSLYTLRSRLCVIPQVISFFLMMTYFTQDPVLFRGTLRKNLDIFGHYDEHQLWDALDSVNLKNQVMAKQNGLDCEVTEGGENFSIGERQLICLARGLLSRARIIILDEATANVDLSTEEKIHNVIFHQCSSSTMFLIGRTLFP